MSSSQDQSRSNNPNAPQIPHSLYSTEKENFVGILTGAIFYGIVIILFFQCMGALLNPVNRTREGIKWGLVAHTMATFSVVTVYTVTNLRIQYISYINNREFPGADGTLPPGPLGYQYSIYSKAISVVPNCMFVLNSWLVDGVLLYRCWVIFAMNYWVIAFPCLMYFASISMGIMLIYYEASQPSAIGKWSTVALNFNYPYFTISLSLNVLLTLMIVARLVLHNRGIRSTMGTPTRDNRLYKAIIAIFVESFAIYAVNFLLSIIPWSVRSSVQLVFFPTLAETQVIAPLLIIQRVANRRALTNDVVVFGTAGPIRSGSQGKSTSSDGEHPLSSIDTHGGTPGGLCVGAETTSGSHHGRLNSH